MNFPSFAANRSKTPPHQLSLHPPRPPSSTSSYGQPSPLVPSPLDLGVLTAFPPPPSTASSRKNTLSSSNSQYALKNSASKVKSLDGLSVEGDDSEEYVKDSEDEESSEVDEDAQIEEMKALARRERLESFESARTTVSKRTVRWPNSAPPLPRKSCFRPQPKESSPERPISRGIETPVPLESSEDSEDSSSDDDFQSAHAGDSLPNSPLLPQPVTPAPPSSKTDTDSLFSTSRENRSSRSTTFEEHFKEDDLSVQAEEYRRRWLDSAVTISPLESKGSSHHLTHSLREYRSSLPILGSPSPAETRSIRIASFSERRNSFNSVTTKRNPFRPKTFILTPNRSQMSPITSPSISPRRDRDSLLSVRDKDKDSFFNRDPLLSRDSLLSASSLSLNAQSVDEESHLGQSPKAMSNFSPRLQPLDNLTETKEDTSQVQGFSSNILSLTRKGEEEEIETEGIHVTPATPIDGKKFQDVQIPPLPIPVNLIDSEEEKEKSSFPASDPEPELEFERETTPICPTPVTYPSKNKTRRIPPASASASSSTRHNDNTKSPSRKPHKHTAQSDIPFIFPRPSSESHSVQSYSSSASSIRQPSIQTQKNRPSTTGSSANGRFRRISAALLESEEVDQGNGFNVPFSFNATGSLSKHPSDVSPGPDGKVPHQRARSRSSIDFRHEISELQNRPPLPRPRLSSIDGPARRKKETPPIHQIDLFDSRRRSLLKNSMSNPPFVKQTGPTTFPRFPSCFDASFDTSFEGEFGHVQHTSQISTERERERERREPPPSPSSHKTEGSSSQKSKGFLSIIGLKRKLKKKNISAPMGITAEGVDVLNLFHMDQTTMSKSSSHDQHMDSRNRNQITKNSLPPGLSEYMSSGSTTQDRRRTMSAMSRNSAAPRLSQRRSSHIAI